MGRQFCFIFFAATKSGGGGGGGGGRRIIKIVRFEIVGKNLFLGGEDYLFL